MKLFYGIILVLMIFVSACAQQAAQPEAEPSEPEAPVAEDEDDGTGVAVAVPEEEPAETSTTDVRYVGAGGFDPDKLTISAGSSVTWFNDDSKSMVMIIFKDGKSFSTQRLNPGQQAETEFTEAGDYDFWWNIAYAAVGGKLTVVGNAMEEAAEE